MATGNRMGAKMQPCLTPEVVETLDDSFCPTLIPWHQHDTTNDTRGSNVCQYVRTRLSGFAAERHAAWAAAVTA